VHAAAAAKAGTKDLAEDAAGWDEKQVKPPVSPTRISVTRRPMDQAHGPFCAFLVVEDEAELAACHPGPCQCRRPALWLITFAEGWGAMEFCISASDLGPRNNLAIVDWMLGRVCTGVDLCAAPAWAGLDLAGADAA